MGNYKTKTAAPTNTGTVVNTVDIHLAHIVNQDLQVILFMLVTIQMIQLGITIYRMWRSNIKKKYLQRTKSMELL